MNQRHRPQDELSEQDQTSEHDGGTPPQPPPAWEMNDQGAQAGDQGSAQPPAHDAELREQGAGTAESEAEDSSASGPSLEKLRRERDELEQKVLRLAADYQNYARRAEQNVASARDQQAMDFARGLVTVLDHFDHALEVDSEKTSTKDLLQGVVMVRDELMRALGRLGIERLEVEPGQPFDPNQHEALMRQPSEQVESDHVTAQLQPGYVLRDKTIRPAKVSVAE